MPSLRGSKRSGGAIAALAACGATAAAVLLASGSSAGQGGRIASEGPAGIVASAGHDALARGSVREIETLRTSTLSATYSDDVAVSEGEQDIHIAGIGDERVVVVGGMAYFTGTQSVLTQVFGFPESVISVIAGRWIDVPRSNAGYAAVAADVTIGSSLSEFMPQQSLTAIGPSSLGGVPVTGIRGTVKATATAPGATVTLFVSRTAKPLPVRIEIRDSQGNTATVAFSNWGERLSIKPPSRTFPLATLQALLSQAKPDTAAEDLAHSAQVAAEVYATDHSGSYVGLSLAALHSYEASIQVTPGNGKPYVSRVVGTSTGYTVTVTSASGDTFSITRTNGAIARTCTPASGINGDCNRGSW